MTLDAILNVAVGGGVVTSLFILFWQSRSSQRSEDERRLAEARVLLARLISLKPNDPLTPIHTGNPHEASQVIAAREQTILELRMQLENTALGIRSKRHRVLAAKILEVAEPPLGEWDEDEAAFLMGRLKAVLGPAIVGVRRGPHALTSDE